MQLKYYKWSEVSLVSVQSVSRLVLAAIDPHHQYVRIGFFSRNFFCYIGIPFVKDRIDLKGKWLKKMNML